MGPLPSGSNVEQRDSDARTIMSAACLQNTSKTAARITDFDQQVVNLVFNCSLEQHLRVAYFQRI